MATVGVHVTDRRWRPSITEKVQKLMEALRVSDMETVQELIRLLSGYANLRHLLPELVAVSNGILSSECMSYHVRIGQIGLWVSLVGPI